MHDDKNQALSKRLDIIISLLLRQLPKAGDTISGRDQIEVLESLGVRPVEISRILGKKESYVSKELVSIRKSKTKRT